MKLIKSFSFTALLALSFNTSAGLISDYTLNKSTNIVTNNDTGLEWLQWDETTSMSPVQALNKYQQDGWQIANRQQMAALYGDFDLGFGFDWLSKEKSEHKFISKRTNESRAWSDIAHANFMSLFGVTHTSSWYDTVGICDFETIGQASTCQYSTGAIYDPQLDDSERYSNARLSIQLFTDWSNSKDTYYSANWSAEPYYSKYWSSQYGGVALVRSSTTTASVPEPETYLLFLSALAAGFIRRKTN